MKPPSPRHACLAALVVLLAIPTFAGADPADPDRPSDRGAPTATENAAPATENARAEADRAITALSRHVTRKSHPDALRLAFQAYYAFRESHPESVRNPYFFYVDYGLGNRTPRGWVFDMDELTLVEGPFTVSHGSGSSKSRNGVPTRFSNRPGSYQSSLGLYVAQETYRFSGKSGGRRYTSVGLRMAGMSGRFNDAARRRGIVSHGAPYVTAGDAGRSQGCPAMEQARAKRLLPLLANGGVVFLYSPRDSRWLREGPWVKAVAG